jgi:hypothetical protein
VKLLVQLLPGATVLSRDIFTAALAIRAGCELKEVDSRGGVIEFRAEGLGILQQLNGKTGETAPRRLEATYLKVERTVSD